ncbi:MAG: 4Fe-4S dicluster domain-containing protein [Acetobacteraceae bacterium]|nr:4Fe-4S dicluster domain-containing protein [Acetobacteraceae bacterium]
MATRSLAVDGGRCIGCRVCEAACSVGWAGEFNPKRARIRVPQTFLEPRPPAFCRHCPEAPCIEACPQGLYRRSPDSGLVELDEEACTGCGECLESCPFHAIFLDPATNRAMKCDLCSGRGGPWCARYCPRGALEGGGAGPGEG